MKTRKNTLRFFFLVGALCFTALHSAYLSAQPALGATPKSITIGFHEYPPYYEQVNEQEVKGMGVDIYRAAFATQGINVVMQGYPIRRAIRKLTSLEINAFTPGTLFIREPKILGNITSVTSFKVILGWLHIKGKGPHDTKDFSNKYISSAARAGSTRDYIRPYFDRGLTLITVEDPQRSIQMLSTERIHFAVVSQLTGLGTLAQSNLDPIKTIGFTALDTNTSDLAFLKDHPDTAYLSRRFQLGLEVIKKNGTYVSILETYWGKDNIPKGALLNDIQSFGTDNFNSKIFFDNYIKLNGTTKAIRE